MSTQGALPALQCTDGTQSSELGILCRAVRHGDCQHPGPAAAAEPSTAVAGAATAAAGRCASLRHGAAAAAFQRQQQCGAAATSSSPPLSTASCGQQGMAGEILQRTGLRPLASPLPEVSLQADRLGASGHRAGGAPNASAVAIGGAGGGAGGRRSKQRQYCEAGGRGG